MKRVLSSIGIGAAKVDTVFQHAAFAPGETVTADVDLYGGDATQEIEGIYRRSRPSASGLDPKGEGRKLRWAFHFHCGWLAFKIIVLLH